LIVNQDKKSFSASLFWSPPLGFKNTLLACLWLMKLDKKHHYDSLNGDTRLDDQQDFNGKRR
jgi:hypothetical protein